MIVGSELPAARHGALVASAEAAGTISAAIWDTSDAPNVDTMPTLIS
jgi:hypothetical protein